jgi:hypothetical protein
MDNSSDVDDRLLGALLNKEIEGASTQQQTYSTTLPGNSEMKEPSTEQQADSTTLHEDNESEEDLTLQQAQSTATPENIQENIGADQIVPEIVGIQVRLPPQPDYSTDF